MANPLVEGEDFYYEGRVPGLHREVPPLRAAIAASRDAGTARGAFGGRREGRSGRSGRCRQKRKLKGKGQRAKEGDGGVFALSPSPFPATGADSSAPRVAASRLPHDVLDIHQQVHLFPVLDDGNEQSPRTPRMIAGGGRSFSDRRSRSGGLIDLQPMTPALLWVISMSGASARSAVRGGGAREVDDGTTSFRRTMIPSMNFGAVARRRAGVGDDLADGH